MILIMVIIMIIIIISDVFIHMIKIHIESYKVELARMFNRHLQYQKLTKNAKLKLLDRQQKYFKKFSFYLRELSTIIS